MAITWITPAGALTSTVTERILLNIPFQAQSSVGPISYTLISGRLPRGLRLDANINQSGYVTTGFIKGSPTEVRRFTTSKFVIRADDGQDIEDRTFIISVDGADVPQWITREGFLNLGPNKIYFVLDNAYVNFQLEAYDPDTNSGEELEYFLMPMGGQLPPGLSLSSDGVISGFTDPIFALEYTTTDNGAFDTGSYDTTPLDYGKNSTLGYDSFIYDIFEYDFSESPIVPRRLSRIYTFAVGVTDDETIETRIFKIYVVTEEFLKSDNTLVQVDTNLFTADNNSLRNPFWITRSDLGRFRANNYITIFLDVFDPPSLPGTIAYFLLKPQIFWNPQTTLYKEGDLVKYDDNSIIKEYICTEEHKPSNNFKDDRTKNRWKDYGVPPGLELDSTTGELAGRVPYQNKVSKKYTFTVEAVNFSVILVDDNYEFVGNWNSGLRYFSDQAVRFNGIVYLCLIENRNIVPSSDDEVWLSSASSTAKTFNVEVIGEIESGIRWLTPNDLGSLKPNRASGISTEAESDSYGGRVVYEIVSGSLPPGLSFLPNGLIIGKVRQFTDQTGLGLTRFYDSLTGPTIFDNSLTTFDKLFKFTVKARDTSFAAENYRDFYITVISDNDKVFANLWVKSFQNSDKRLQWTDFISNISIFDPRNLYRYGDTNFGIQNEIKMLVFGGIESVDATKYVQAMSRNHSKKRLLFGDLKSAKAKDPNTQKTIYEVVYVDIIDEYEKNGKSISQEIQLKNNINSKILISYDSITIDSDIPFVSDSDHQRIFPNSIKNMRTRIRGAGERDRDFLPLWMRSIQDQADYELGYTKALVLWYAKPGKSAEIMAKIKASGFDFKQINFLADRYIIDILDGEIQDKYLAFPQRGEKRP